MRAPIVPVRVLVVIAVIEGIGLIGCGVFDLIETMRVGVTGPEDVSNGPAVAVLIAIQVVFGAGLLWVARGWWRSAPWARSPFLVAQLLLVLVGYDLAQGTSAAEKAVGFVAIAVAGVGIVVTFLPAVRRALDPAEDPPLPLG